jgi:hypothetical protein
MSANYADLIMRVSSIRDSIGNARAQIIIHFPHYDINRDVRVNIFSKCINALDGLYLGLIFYNNHLTDSDWWDAVASRMNLIVPPVNDRLALVDNFAISLKIGFIQTLVSSAIESSIRTVASYVNNEEYRKRGFI